MYFDILINIITKNHIITQLCQYQNQFHDKDVANESSQFDILVQHAYIAPSSYIPLALPHHISYSIPNNHMGLIALMHASPMRALKEFRGFWGLFGGFLHSEQDFSTLKENRDSKYVLFGFVFFHFYFPSRYVKINLTQFWVLSISPPVLKNNNENITGVACGIHWI